MHGRAARTRSGRVPFERLAVGGEVQARDLRGDGEDAGVRVVAVATEYPMSRRTKKSSTQPSPEALFRYRLVSEVRAGVLRGENQADAVCAVAGRDHPDFNGNLRRVSERTLYRWLKKLEL